jgi:hypothetical protein
MPGFHEDSLDGIVKTMQRLQLFVNRIGRAVKSVLTICHLDGRDAIRWLAAPTTSRA